MPKILENPISLEELKKRRALYNKRYVQRHRETHNACVNRYDRKISNWNKISKIFREILI